MADQTNTYVTSEGELLAEYWRNIFLSELRDNLVLWDHGLKSPHPTGTGKLAHWIAMADLTAAAALSEATDPTAFDLSGGDQTATVTQYGAVTYLSDLMQKTWLDGSYQQVLERLARNAALTLDTVVRDTVFSAGGSAQYAGTAVARSGCLTDGSAAIGSTTAFDADIAEIREAVNSLESNNVPTFPDGFYVGVIHPDVKYDLQGDTANWQEILKHTETGYGAFRDEYTGMRPGGGGMIGRMFGVKFLMSQLALLLDASGSASCDVYQSYIFGPEHYGVSQLDDVQIIIQNPSPKTALDLYGSAGWKAAFATKELSSSRMTRLETGASLGD